MIPTIAQGYLQDTQNWLNSSVQSFFSDCNWDNQTQRSTTQEVERLEQAVTELFTELSFELRVRQFFAAVNWDGTAAVSPVTPIEPPPEPSDGFTLTDFSDLF